MTAAEPPATISWWQQSSWFASGVNEPAALPAAAASEEAGHSAAAPTALVAAPGGAKAQSRFSGKTAMPMFRSVPVDGAPVLGEKQSSAAPQAYSPLHGAASSLATGRHAQAGWQQQGTGHTCDGSAAAHHTGDVHEHVSRWVFDLDSWCWQRKGEEAGATGVLQPSAKHQLAARRWGDGRDMLAAALGTSAGPAAATDASSSKRPRLEVSAACQGSAVGADTKRTAAEPPADGFACVGGLTRQKEALLRCVAYPLRHPALFRRLGVPALRGTLLYGPPGSGKSHLVRALAAEVGLPCVTLSCGECSGEEGAARLRRAFAEAKSVAPSLLFLDELDALGPSTSAASSDSQRQMAAALLAAVDGLRASQARVALLAASNRREGVDPALRRAGRLDVELQLGALSRPEREEVLRCASRGMPLQPGVDLSAVAARLHGHTAADCAAVCTEAALRCAVEVLLAATPDGQLESALEADSQALLEVPAAVGQHHFEAAVAALGPASLRELAPEVPEVCWQQIGGLEELKAELTEMVELPTRHGALLHRMGVRPPRGALLYGPPGCGKTLLAKAVASQCGANFLSVRGPELLQKWLGESERAVRELFAAARGAAPTVLFFDEVDALAPRRGGGSGAAASAAGDSAAARVLNQMLAEMDGLTAGSTGSEGAPPLVLVLCATNRPEALDPALLRPGRLDRVLLVPLPDEGARRQVLAASLARCPLAPDVDLGRLAAETEGMSGADLAELARRAGMSAIRELIAAEEQAWQAAEQQQGQGQAAVVELPPALLTWRHLQQALAGLRPSVSREEAARYASLAQALERGSLPGGQDQLSAQQRKLVRALVQRLRGEEQAREQALQERVALLEGMLAAAGLEVPPAHKGA